MDFELPEELRILKAGLRRFVDNELIPIERQTTDGEKASPARRRAARSIRSKAR